MNNVQHPTSSSSPLWRLALSRISPVLLFLFVSSLLLYCCPIPNPAFFLPFRSLHPLVIPFYPVRVLTTEPLTLTDDNILIQMGAAREGQTEEEKETYLAGLKEIINDLRRDKVKDFNTVAAEIAAYRRRFLQDPSRVLSL
jgi:hypothetical protein